MSGECLGGDSWVLVGSSLSHVHSSKDEEDSEDHDDGVEEVDLHDAVGLTRGCASGVTPIDTPSTENPGLGHRVPAVEPRNRFLPGKSTACDLLRPLSDTWNRERVLSSAGRAWGGGGVSFAEGPLRELQCLR